MEENKQEEVVETNVDENEDNEFINSLLDIEEEKKEKTPEELAKEEELRKNKDAEEARKRREKEAKEKKDAEAKAKAEEALKEKEAKAKAEEEAKASAEKEKKATANKTRQEKLGAELTEFKEKYPDVDLKEIDKDEDFKEYIDGKLLGKKNFTQLYEGFVKMRSKFSGQEEEAIKRNYRKANSSSGSGGGNTGDTPTDVYSEAELNQIAQKLPFMSREAAAEVEAKIDRSIAYYDKN